MSRAKPKKGDLVEVTWIDHCGSTDDKDIVECPILVEPGYYREVKKVHGQEILVTDRNQLKCGEKEWDKGWDAYPMGAVLDIRIIRRA